MRSATGRGKGGQRDRRRAIALAIGVVLAVGAAALYIRYRHELRAAEERIAADRRVVDTPCGAIEYGERGAGRAVLVLHGAGGGFDQGLLMAEPLADRFRVIAPSRFGYLGTSIPQDASVAAQARAYLCLLDALGLARAAVVAGSAGGPSALQLALDAPDRIDALVLVSAIGTLRPIRDAASGPSPALLTDFAYWLAITARPTLVLGALGIPESSLRHLSNREVERMRSTLRTMMPMSRRLPGMARDAIEQGRPAVVALPIERITAPTLVVHALDDALIPIAQGRDNAARIPHARLVEVRHGGHFAFALDAVAAEIRTFLSEWRSPAAPPATGDQGRP